MLIRTSSGAMIDSGVERRAFSLSSMAPYGWQPRAQRSDAGVVVTPEKARGVPALSRAVQVFSEQLASLRLGVWRGRAPNRVRVDTSPLDKFFAGPANECQSRFGFWETVGESLKWRGNAWVWILRDPATNLPVEWYALHPDQVDEGPGDTWIVTVADGFIDPMERGRAVYQVGPDVILHIRGHGDGGMRCAPSPIKQFADAMGISVARQKMVGRSYANGTRLQAVATFPEKVTKEQADLWSSGFRASYIDGGGTVIPLGGGADLKPIGMTLEDAQVVEVANLTTRESAQIMGVPSEALDAESRTPVLFEIILAKWLRFGLNPELERIESHVMAHPALPAPRGAHFAFDTEGFVRGDLATEADIAHKKVQSGIWLADEARAMDGLPPLADGLGQIPQVVPVGGTPNPNTTPPPAATSQE